jgi:hypothetical protein
MAPGRRTCAGFMLASLSNMCGRRGVCGFATALCGVIDSCSSAGADPRRAACDVMTSGGWQKWLYAHCCPEGLQNPTMLRRRERWSGASAAGRPVQAGETMPERPWGVSRRRREVVDDARRNVKSPARVVCCCETARSRGDGVAQCLAAREGALRDRRSDVGKSKGALGRSRRPAVRRKV